MNVSYVIPCYRSEKTIGGVVEEIRTAMQKHPEDSYEIILVNDASPDGTFGEIRRICSLYDNVTGIDLAKNFGQHSALMAGLNAARGEITVCLDDDGQTPAHQVYRLIDKIREGYDVVYARYEHKKHSLFRNFGSRVNARMTESLLNKPRELYISSYFAARHFVVEEMIRYKNAYPYVIGLVLRTTGRICNVDVDHRERQTGASGYTFSKLLNLWINGFTAFSVKPLRIAAYGGIVVAVLGFLYAVYTVINKVVNPTVPVGWSSTMSAMLILGGAILFVLGMIGEYIGRIYICMNNSPQYVVRTVVRSEETAEEAGRE